MKFIEMLEAFGLGLDNETKAQLGDDGHREVQVEATYNRHVGTSPKVTLRYEIIAIGQAQDGCYTIEFNAIPCAATVNGKVLSLETEAVLSLEMEAVLSLEMEAQQ